VAAARRKFSAKPTLNAADRVVAHKARFGVLDHPVRFNNLEAARYRACASRVASRHFF